MSTPSSTPTAIPWTAPSIVIATVFWLGRLRPAPGSWGAMVGIPLSLATGCAATWMSGGFTQTDHEAVADATTGFPTFAIGIEFVLLASIVAIAVPICTRAARLMAKGKDPSAIVLDETASLPMGLLVVPFAERDPSMLVVGWLLHRLFDISKPFPCRRLERLSDGLGIMADDLAAAGWMAATIASLRAADLL